MCSVYVEQWYIWNLKGNSWSVYSTYIYSLLIHIYIYICINKLYMYVLYTDQLFPFKSIGIKNSYWQLSFRFVLKRNPTNQTEFPSIHDQKKTINTLIFLSIRKVAEMHLCERLHGNGWQGSRCLLC